MPMGATTVHEAPRIFCPTKWQRVPRRQEIRYRRSVNMSDDDTNERLGLLLVLAIWCLMCFCCGHVHAECHVQRW